MLWFVANGKIRQTIIMKKSLLKKNTCFPFCQICRFSSCGVKGKSLSKDFALNHFDNFYGSIFSNWSSVRLALLCPHSYCAIVNSFSNFKQNKSFFQKLGAYRIREEIGKLYSFGFHSVLKADVCDKSKVRGSEEQKKSGELNNEELDYFVPAVKFRDLSDVIRETSNFKSYFNDINVCDVSITNDHNIEYPEYLNVYMFPKGQSKEFPPPAKDNTGVLNYYLMDGASILPVLALDVQKGDSVGDFCASPGGKSLAIIFGMKFGKLVCNDISSQRVRKMKTVLNSYLPYVKDWNKNILVSNIDVCSWHMFDAFDKILLDVPCTNDRLSVIREGNNIFKQERFHERMILPQTQTEMLCKALQALKPGGTLIYSTCTLSPIQNDGVVHMALSKLQCNTSMKFDIKDLSAAFYPMKKMFEFSDICKYGQLVVPFLPLNYGPMYISKISRIK